MRGKISGTTKCGIIIALAALAATQLSVRAQGGATERGLEGVWEVTTTPRDCTTGDPIPAAAFVALYTFERDGTTISWYSSGTPSTGQGLWARAHGWSNYSFRLVRLLRGATGVFSGKQVLGGTVTLSESGDEYTSDEYMIVYDINGVPGTPRCINSVGTRFKLEP